MIALLTDFGLDDHYVGLMKAALISLAPNVPIVDITHSIRSYSIAAGSFALACAFDYLAEGTVVVVVVDPGVGSNRRRIAVQIAGKSVVCPDNGILGDLLHRHTVDAAVELDRNELFATKQSPTFDGRDVFAPIAARLATGSSLLEVGTPIPNAHSVLASHALVTPAVNRDSRAIGHVRHINSFGTLVTDIRPELLPKINGPLNVRVGVVEPRLVPFVRTYSDVKVGEPCLLTGSSGYVEFACRNGRASDWFEYITPPVLAIIEAP